ncbi:MAG: pentapeptide repeat-containing protein, partial [Boseongicola sp. SB0673_bin_14]|nr:pentapeptide repeat-containing protein [Boseongicola sp. SB0673_bin_14]
HDRNRNVGNKPQDAGKPGAGLSQEQFDQVFESMAVAAWRTGGTRAASWEEVLAEVDREDSYLPTGTRRLRDVFETHMTDGRAQRPFRLAAAFFMRNERATGIEFTHKSFGDFLYARRLARALAKMADELMLTTAVEQEMLCRWEALTSEHRMSPEVRRFLKLEIEATVDAETLSARHDALTPVVERVDRDGWPIAGEAAGRRAEQKSCQMEEALFVGWHSMWRPVGKRQHWRLGDNTGDLLFRALARQGSAHGIQGRLEFCRNWSGVDLRDATLNDVYLFGADLHRANLQGAHLSASRLQEANLEGAILKDAYLTDAVFTHANLENADMRGAIHGAYYVEANLAGANLSVSDLCRSNLARSNLRGANLSKATLAGANLEHADLRDSELEGADLEEANLRGANLQGAKLKDANLKGANLDEAKGL